MRHYGRRFGGRKRKIYGQKVQHSPSLMGNAPINNVGLLHVLAHASQLAGGSMTAARTGNEDRTTEVDNGRVIGKTTVDWAFTPGTNTSGYYEYAVVKYERSTSVPGVGTDPVPSSADMAAEGLQRSVRSLTPGYVIQFDTIPVTAETSRSKKIVINWAKYGKAIVRDGDYFCIIFFNRADATATYDLQIRYNTYSVK